MRWQKLPCHYNQEEKHNKVVLMFIDWKYLFIYEQDWEGWF